MFFVFGFFSAPRRLGGEQAFAPIAHNCAIVSAYGESDIPRRRAETAQLPRRGRKKSTRVAGRPHAGVGEFGPSHGARFRRHVCGGPFLVGGQLGTGPPPGGEGPAWGGRGGRGTRGAGRPRAAARAGPPAGGRRA